MGCTTPQPHKTLQGFELYYGKLRAPCISTPACYWLRINLDVAAKILGVHEYLKINSRYCVVPRKSIAVDGRQWTSRGCSFFLTPPHLLDSESMSTLPAISILCANNESDEHINPGLAFATGSYLSCASTNCFSKLVGTCRLPTTLGNSQQ